MSLPYFARDARPPTRIVVAAKDAATVRGAGGAQGAEPQAARHHHPQVAGERLHGGAGLGRLDQRGAAPDRHRPRGGGRVDAGDFDRIGEKVPALPTSSLRQHARGTTSTAPAAPAGDEGAARCRPPARRLPDRHRRPLAETSTSVPASTARAGRRQAAQRTRCTVGPPGDPVRQPRPEGAVAKVAGLKEGDDH